MTAIQARRIKALTLRKRGFPYKEIAAQLGVSLTIAHGDVAAALKSIRTSRLAAARVAPGSRAESS